MNPCEMCIVNAMCRNTCYLLEEFLNKLIKGECKFDVVPSYYIGDHIRINSGGGNLILVGNMNNEEHRIHIMHKRGKIHSIVTYPVYHPFKGSMVFYKPVEGVKVYELKNKICSEGI